MQLMLPACHGLYKCIDLPSSPSLTVVAESLPQIIFVISPPLYAGQCVLNYTITATSSDGSVVPDITVPVTDTEATTLAARSAFDFCNNTYTFTVVANTLTGPGEPSMSVMITIPEVVDFFSEFITIYVMLVSYS